MTNIPNLERLERLERLEHLKTVARNIAPATFRMQSYFTRLPTVECGLVACLGGHASLDPVFNAQGLTVEFSERNQDYTMCVDGDDCGDDPFRVLQRFFEVSSDEAAYLFLPGSYDTIFNQQPTNDELVEHINHVIDGVIPDEDEGTES
jgi:hypothetical protein